MSGRARRRAKKVDPRQGAVFLMAGRHCTVFRLQPGVRSLLGFVGLFTRALAHTPEQYPGAMPPRQSVYSLDHDADGHEMTHAEKQRTMQAKTAEEQLAHVA